MNPDLLRPRPDQDAAERARDLLLAGLAPSIVAGLLAREGYRSPRGGWYRAGHVGRLAGVPADARPARKPRRPEPTIPPAMEGQSRLDRARQLRTAGLTFARCAEVLEAEGHRAPSGGRIWPGHVRQWLLRTEAVGG